MLLHTTLWTTFTYVALNIYLIYLKQPWSVFRLLLCTNTFYWMTHNLLLLMGFREKRTKVTTTVWSKNEKSEDMEYPHAASGSRKRDVIANYVPGNNQSLLFRRNRRFVQPGHIPAPSAPQRSEQALRSPARRIRAGMSLGVTRSLCKQELGLSTGEQQQESPEDKKGQNESTFCNHGNPELLR